MKKANEKMLTIWVSKSLMACLDEAVKKEDSDRSKFIRNAIREKLKPCGSPKKSA